MPRKTRIDKGEWIPAFLAALKSHGIIRLACQQANVTRRTVYLMKDNNEEFAEQWNEAIEEATDTLVAVARQRAINGSDRLLEFLLKSHRKEVYGESLNLNQQIKGDYVIDLSEAINNQAITSNSTTDSTLE